ncbi:MAG: cytochrome C oxidase subunit IV family protein [Verrucomicrobiia bacterium]
MNHQEHHHNAHHVQREVRRYLFIFLALLIGTIVTVGAYYVHLSSVALTVAVALFIASIKAFLVAGYFMHLISERKLIYGILVATIFFFAGLMYLTVWSMQPTSLIHIKDVP